MIEPKHLQTKWLLVLFDRSYQTTYGKPYWAAKNALRGKASQRVIDDFDALCAFLELHLPQSYCDKFGVSWEAYLLYAMKADKAWKASVRVPSLASVDNMKQYQDAIMRQMLARRAESHQYTTHCDLEELCGSE